MAPPPLTPEQRQAALAKATETRRARSEMLHALRTGRLSLTDVLGRTDAIARRTRLIQVLTAIPGYGPVTAARLMSELGIVENRRLGGLGVQQRRTLAEAISR